MAYFDSDGIAGAINSFVGYFKYSIFAGAWTTLTLLGVHVCEDDDDADDAVRVCVAWLQDKAVKDKIDARNQLETYVYNMKNTVEDKLKDKISEEDKETVLKVSRVGAAAGAGGRVGEDGQAQGRGRQKQGGGGPCCACWGGWGSPSSVRLLGARLYWISVAARCLNTRDTQHITCGCCSARMPAAPPPLTIVPLLPCPPPPPGCQRGPGVAGRERRRRGRRPQGAAQGGGGRVQPHCVGSIRGGRRRRRWRRRGRRRPRRALSALRGIINPSGVQD